MFKYVIDLKQHSPIIHFQYEQKGATLRASEVKPKLDRFIFDNFTKININNDFSENLRELFNPGNKIPSSYKLVITPPDKEIDILISSYLSNKQIETLKNDGKQFMTNTPYFAMEKYIKNYVVHRENVPIHGKLADPLSTIRLQFFSLNNNIIEIIKKCIHSFFACNNFGTRQSKGFGSFYPSQPIENFEQAIKKYYDTCFRYTDKNNNRNRENVLNINDLLSKINQDYRHIKSGISASMRGGYKKAQTFLYGLVNHPTPYRWDKRAIKIHINNNKINNLSLKTTKSNSAIYDTAGKNYWSKQSDEQYKYIRAMLGLAEIYEFQTQNLATNHSAGPKYVATVKGIGKSQDIQRFRSPILWKIFENNIYVVATDIPECMLDASFSIGVKLGKSKIEENLVLKTPSKFSIHDFLDFCFQRSPEKINGYKKI